jgi:acyl dehydratase
MACFSAASARILEALRVGYWPNAALIAASQIDLLLTQLGRGIKPAMGLGWDELKLTNPVRPGDALDLEMTILELRPSKSKPDWGIARNQNLLRNQRRETVLECISTIFVARRPDANTSPR